MKEIIQKLAKTADEIYAKIGEVVSVDKDNLTVDVQPLDGSALIDDAICRQTATMAECCRFRKLAVWCAWFS
ncbi:hypothetical protein [Flavobacterium columnare]|uniref:hypothetical protein n=1 Tax=Flavobacterium columnare TaxID=996 RepID=UPI002989ECC0|nr:hypothetical protein [Flavobacterium columnare]